MRCNATITFYFAKLGISSKSSGDKFVLFLSGGSRTFRGGVTFGNQTRTGGRVSAYRIILCICELGQISLFINTQIVCVE